MDVAFGPNRCGVEKLIDFDQNSGSRAVDFWPGCFLDCLGVAAAGAVRDR
jgi:hypothetical protein